MYFSKGVNLSFCSKKGMFSLFVFGQKRTRNKVYDVLDRKETFYDYKNNNFLTTQKWHFFKGVNPCFWSNNAIWFSLFSVKKGLEIRFNDVLDIKETFFYHKNKNFSTSQKLHFFHFSIWLKNAIFFINCFRSK